MRKRARQIIASILALVLLIAFAASWLGAPRAALAAGSGSPSTPTTPSALKDLDRVSFKLDVMPVLMVAGCNSGACHGSARGQDGFHLSLFGFDPDGDYYRITREMPNRRINLAQPTESLLLQKAIGAVPHGGGAPFKPDSPYYKTILAWIQQGAKADPADIPTPVALDVQPKELLLKGPGGTQQMSAHAKYSDGTERDVTNLAVFMTSNDNSAGVSHEGLVTAKNRGEAFVMARFATFTVGSQAIVVPKDAPTYVWPNVPENNYIDHLVNAKLQKLQILPSGLCDDATFVRRVFIDVTGALPTTKEFDDFLASTDPKKREKIVDELIARPEFVDLWVMKWAELLKIRSTDQVTEMSYKATLLYFDWLKDQFAKNVPINQIVKQLIGSTGGTFKNPPSNYYQTENETLKLAENTAQAFAGIRMQCAQCHNHPFDRWTMNDYYGFASFFTQIGRKPAEDGRETIIFNSGGGEVNHPVTGKPVPAKFLGGAVADVKGKDRRAVLAEWLTSPDNPYFARNIANICWAQFFGKGIVDPVDDVRISNPPSNPQLLDELSRRLITYNFDLKKLVRDICLSRTYQLASTTNATNADDSRSCSHAAVRRIRAEVLLDCISEVTESKEKFRGLPLGARAVQIADGRTQNYFLRTFGRATRETVCSCEVKMEPNLSQALHLLNGQTVERKIASGGAIKKLLAQKKTPPQIVEELYERCFSRKPTKDETTKIDAMLAESPKDPQPVLTDLFWALLNSKEFIFTH